MQNDENIKKIIAGSVIIFIGIIISKFLTYLYRLVVAKLGPEQYGTLSIGIAIVSIFAMFASAGFDYGVARYVAFYKGKDDMKSIRDTILTAFKFVIPTSIVAFLVLYFSSDIFATSLFNNKSLIVIIKILSPIIIFEAIRRIVLEIIRAYQKVHVYSISKNMIEPAVNLSLAFILIYLGFGLNGAAIAYTIAILLGMLFVFYAFSRKIYPLFKQIKEKSSIQKELFYYSFPLMFSILLSRTMAWTDILILGYFRQSSDVGIYNVALPTAQLLLIIPTAIFTLFMPIITELLAKNKNKEINNIHRFVTKWILIINLPIFLVLIFYPVTLIRLLFGDYYTSGYFALIILSIGFLINSLVIGSRYILDAFKKPKTIFINTVIATVFNISLSIVLVPRYGITGAAISTAVSISIFSLLCLIASYRITKLIPLTIVDLRVLLAGFLSVFLMKRIYFLSYENSLISFIIFCMVFIIIYLVIILLIRCLDNQDIALIKEYKSLILKK